jgi:hypothetical protein
VLDADPGAVDVNAHDLELRHLAGLVAEDRRELRLGSLAGRVPLDDPLQLAVEKPEEEHGEELIASTGLLSTVPSGHDRRRGTTPEPQ